MSPEIEWIEPPESPDRTSAHGREAAMGALMLWLSTWASYESELRGITAHGERVLVEFRQRMVGASSRLEVEGDLFMVWTIHDGLATRMAMYTDRSQAEADLAA